MSPASKRRRVKIGHPLTQLELLGREGDAASRDDEIHEREPCVRDERQRAGDKALGNSGGRRARGCEPSGTLPNGVDRQLRRRLELFRAPRQQQREDWISQQSCGRDVGARDPEVGERALKRGVVPQRDGDRFILREAVVQEMFGGSPGSPSVRTPCPVRSLMRSLI